MNNHYDMKEQMEEILKTKDEKEFFDKLNAADIPFFFIPQQTSGQEP